MEEEITRLSGTERSDNRVKLNDRKLAGVINVRENRVARARESAGLVLAGVNSDLVSGLGRPSQPGLQCLRVASWSPDSVRALSLSRQRRQACAWSRVALLAWAMSQVVRPKSARAVTVSESRVFQVEVSPSLTSGHPNQPRPGPSASRATVARRPQRRLSRLPLLARVRAGLVSGRCLVLARRFRPGSAYP